MMPAVALPSQYAPLATYSKHEYFKSYAVKTAQGANGAYNTFVYNYQPKITDIHINQLLKFITESTLNMSCALDDLRHNESYTSEMYRQTRILYDDVLEARKEIIVNPLSATMMQQLPIPILDLVDAVYRLKCSMDEFIEHTKAYFDTLDKPIENYESLFFRRMSEQEVWESRCKAYSYRF
jgi:hypothetical protein